MCIFQTMAADDTRLEILRRELQRVNVYERRECCDVLVGDTGMTYGDAALECRASADPRTKAIGLCAQGWCSSRYGIAPIHRLAIACDVTDSDAYIGLYEYMCRAEYARAGLPDPVPLTDGRVMSKSALCVEALRCDVQNGRAYSHVYTLMCRDSWMCVCDDATRVHLCVPNDRRLTKDEVAVRALAYLPPQGQFSSLRAAIDCDGVRMNR
jgi:hypothetical protein